MSAHPLIACLPLVATCLLAAAIDVRSRRIPNWLSAATAAAGLANSLTPNGLVSPGQAALGLLAGFALLVFPYAIGAIGGGDVKLLAAVGAWVGPAGVLTVFVAASIAGLLIVLAQCAATGRLGLLFRNSALAVVSVANVRRLGADHVAATGRSLRSVDRPLPYAVPILVGVLARLGGG